MTCNSAIYIVNNSSQDILANGQIPVGTVIRRFGQYTNVQDGNVLIGSCNGSGNGYYKCDCTVTLEAAAIGNVTAQVYLNGVPYPGATATEYAAAAGNTVTISIPTFMVRLHGCCNTMGTLQVRLGDAAGTLVNMGMFVEKL